MKLKNKAQKIKVLKSMKLLDNLDSIKLTFASMKYKRCCWSFGSCKRQLSPQSIGCCFIHFLRRTSVTATMLKITIKINIHL